MRRFSFHQIDAFTTSLFGGNPAAIVEGSQDLSDTEMQSIAREMNLPETAFQLPSEKGHFALRYFTPGGQEVKFCGHATVAALYLWGLNHGCGEYVVEFGSGTLRAIVSSDPCRQLSIIMETPPVNLASLPFPVHDLRRALDLDPELLDNAIHPKFETNFRYVLLASPSLEALGKIEVDQGALRDFAQLHNVICFAIICPKTFDPDFHLHSRAFAPLVGIPEDPFTGSLQAGAARFARSAGMVPLDIPLLKMEQGHFVNRPGEACVRIDDDDTYFLMATAKPVFSSTLQLN